MGPVRCLEAVRLLDSKGVKGVMEDEAVDGLGVDGKHWLEADLMIPQQHIAGNLDDDAHAARSIVLCMAW